ncbi:hypothetical protein RI367_003702 [Sorochytrium milnesiophthora]
MPPPSLWSLSTILPRRSHSTLSHLATLLSDAHSLPASSAATHAGPSSTASTAVFAVSQSLTQSQQQPQSSAPWCAPTEDHPGIGACDEGDAGLHVHASSQQQREPLRAATPAQRIREEQLGRRFCAQSGEDVARTIYFVEPEYKEVVFRIHEAVESEHPRLNADAARQPPHAQPAELQDASDVVDQFTNIGSNMASPAGSTALHSSGFTVHKSQTRSFSHSALPDAFLADAW